MEEELKPTIENPFATSPTPKQAQTKQTGQTRAGRLATPTETLNTRKRAFAPSPYASLREERPVQEDDYDPGYFVSRVARRSIQDKVNEGQLTRSEVPVIFKIGKIVAEIFDRPTPTTSDLEVAWEFRNVETMKMIVEGQKDVTLVRSDPGTLAVIPLKERIQLWRKVAEVVLKKWDDQ